MNRSCSYITNRQGGIGALANSTLKVETEATKLSRSMKSMTSAKTRMAIISAAVMSMALICGCGHENDKNTRKQNSPSAPDPSAQLSPFTKVRYDGDTVNVTYDGVEYQLAAMDNLSTADMLAFCRKHYGKLWQKRFAEDLVAVWNDMGHPINAEPTVNLTLVDAKTGEEKTVKGAIMSNENRALVRGALSASTHALPANP